MMRHSRVTGVLVTVALALAVAACEGGSTVAAGARATQTAGAAATRAADATTAAQGTRAVATVWLGLKVAVKGSAERGDAEMDVTVMVTNRTDAPIRIAGSCDRPAILLTILKKGGGYAYSTNQGVLCADGTGHDIDPAIAAGASHRWTYHIALAPVWYGDVPPGAYSVTAYVHDWHQGTFEDLFKSPAPLFGGAWAATTVIVP